MRPLIATFLVPFSLSLRAAENNWTSARKQVEWTDRGSELQPALLPEGIGSHENHDELPATEKKKRRIR